VPPFETGTTPAVEKMIYKSLKGKNKKEKGDAAKAVQLQLKRSSRQLTRGFKCRHYNFLFLF